MLGAETGFAVLPGGETFVGPLEGSMRVVKV